VKLESLALALLVLAALPLIVHPAASPVAGDPCDGYGNCISSSISYLRSNPDLSLYLGDEFVVTPSVSLGPNTVSYSLSWSYDGAVLVALEGGLFQDVGNVTGTYSVTITANFTITEVVGNSTVTIHSSLSTSQSVDTRAFVLTFQTGLSNFTNSGDQVLRNPDGSSFTTTNSSSTPRTASCTCSSDQTSRSWYSPSSTRRS
jgi:hypothetical protein